VPALTVVAPATNTSAVCVTASLLVVTLRLAAGLPPVPIAPSCVAMLLTSVTAPVPAELTAPPSWLVASSTTRRRFPH
jgi:hypothetical protein